jgi:tRNA(adenine34) deaminase
MSDNFLGDFHPDNFYMGQALREAQRAYAAQEVPIGAIIVKGDQVIARAWNQVETLKDATAHAEMLALTSAQNALGDWRLEGCTLFVTKEPCPMCAGAIVHCRLDRVVFGCSDLKAGAAGGWINLLESNPPLNHCCNILSGVLEGECVSILKSFFREARERNALGKAHKKAGRQGSDFG